MATRLTPLSYYGRGGKELSAKAVQTLVAGPGDTVDLPAAMEMLREKLGN